MLASSTLNPLSQSTSNSPSSSTANPHPDRESVKILVIGSKRSVSSIVVALHQLGFAEIFEWTDFLSAPNSDRPLQFQPHEVMKALVKYMPRE
ncbi:hypothetical protein [Nodosilinea sp. FACHB-141]|uniref:hypothetical protein n=1 Tax=Nodosilinea sp. FACHB-141 TaxID=2692833 RepID=UPI001F556B48|nr:hypothetical protein [Nodosilinea sp. FACHB-141]